MDNIKEHKIIYVNLEDIEHDFKYQARQHFDKETLSLLSKSIKRNGFFQNVVLQEKDNGKYKVVAGETRVLAAKKNGLQSVPAVVLPKDIESKQLIEITFGENFNRKAIDFFELFLIIATIKKENNLQNPIDMLKYFNNVIPYNVIVRALSYEFLHQNIIDDLQNKQVVLSPKTVLTMRGTYNRVVKKYKLDKNTAFEKYIFSPYNKFKKFEITRKEFEKILKSIAKEESSGTKIEATKKDISEMLKHTQDEKILFDIKKMLQGAQQS